MPSTRKTGRKPVKKPQTRRAPARPVDDPIDPVPATAIEETPTPPAPPAQPVASEESLFDETPSEPVVAEQPTEEPAQPDEAPADDRPEGVVDEEEQPAPTGPVQDAPAETVEEPAPAQQPAEAAAQDQGGDDAQEEQPAPPAVETEGETASESDPAKLLEELKQRREALQQQPDGGAVEEPEQQQEAVEPSPGDPTTVRLGQVTGLLHRMPLDAVMSYADEFASKIEGLQYASQVQDLIPRVRASEGRCAPIYFSMDDDGEPEFLIAGDDALAAAKAAGIETVSVVLFHPGDAGAIQAYLNQQASTAAVSTEDDELVWRAHNEAS